MGVAATLSELSEWTLPGTGLLGDETDSSPFPFLFMNE